MRLKQSEKTVLLGFSGGLDSTYVLWYLLTQTDYKVYAHHIQMQYTTIGSPNNPVNPGRWEFENNAVQKINTYFANNGFRKYNFTTGVYNAPIPTVDIEVILFMLTQVAMMFNGSVMISTGRVREDDERWASLGGYYPGNIARKIMKLSIRNFENTIPLFRKSPIAQINPKTFCPAQNKNKKQIMSEMPKKLINLTWSCRNPLKQNDKFIECGVCHSCLALKVAKL